MAKATATIPLAELAELHTARADKNVLEARVDRLERALGERTGRPVVILELDEVADLETARRLGEMAARANDNLAERMLEAESVAHTRQLAIGDLRSRIKELEGWYKAADAQRREADADAEDLRGVLREVKRDRDHWRDDAKTAQAEAHRLDRDLGQTRAILAGVRENGGR